MRNKGIGSALAIGAVAAGTFAAAASLRLGAQGLQYDELHQAVGAFAWCGRAVPFFVADTVFGLPVLNMSYSGALKTAVYGLYLRVTGLPFTPESWRALGIAFVALGLVALCLLGWRSSRRMLAVLVALLISDADILLQARHDWGPVALGLLLRLLFVGVWLHASALEAPARWHVFALGLLVGVASFEKLSSVVLVIPLVILVLSDARLRDRRSLGWCAGGLLLGVSPVVALNVASWNAGGFLISLRDATGFALPSAHLDKVWGYLSLAAGRDAARVSLGTTVPRACELIEGLCLGAAAILCAAWGAGMRAGGRWPRRFVACWLGVGLGLACLPSEEVWFHHWIVGTPFQYGAIAWCAAGFGAASTAGRARALQGVLKVVLGILLVNRLVVMAGVVGWLAEGRAARGFDPELNRLGAFAARQDDDVTFIAATWGVGTQIYCFSNGREGVVAEPFWSYAGPRDLEQAAEGRRAFYVVATVPLSDVSPESSMRIMMDAGALAGWTVAPVEPEVASLRTLHVTKHLRSRTSSP